MGLPVCPLTWRRVRMGPRGAFPGDVPRPYPRRPHPVQRHVWSRPVPTSATARASGRTPRIPGRVAAGASARAFLPLIHRPSGHKSHLVPSLNKGCRRIPVHKSPNPCSFPSRQDSESQRPLRARHSGPATRRVGLAASTPALFSAVTLITGTSLGGSRVPPAMSRSFFFAAARALCSAPGPAAHHAAFSGAEAASPVSPAAHTEPGTRQCLVELCLSTCCETFSLGNSPLSAKHMCSDK